MNVMASQITSLKIGYSTVYSGAYQRKYQSSASLAFVMGIHRWPMNSPHKGPVTRKMFPFYDAIIKGPVMTQEFPCHGVHMFGLWRMGMFSTICIAWKILRCVQRELTSNFCTNRYTHLTLLTHLRLDKMAAKLQAITLSAFSSLKTCDFEHFCIDVFPWCSIDE